MDRIEQRLRDVFPHSLGPRDTLSNAEAIFSILPILAILSCCSRSSVVVISSATESISEGSRVMSS